MGEDDLTARACGVCEFCGSGDGLEAVAVAPLGAVLLCATCREETPASAGHWRCLEGAAWSGEAAVQLAVWRKLGRIDEPWAIEARNGMVLAPEVARLADAAAVAAVEHRDSNGTVLAQGDSVVLIKDLAVKGAGFTAKRGTVVRGIVLVEGNGAQIEGRVEGQRIVILTEFVKKR